MKGFFEKEKTTLPYKSEKGTLSCASCGLYKYTLSPRMEPYGGFKKEIMVIGEAPGEDEDRKGRPWQGKMGRALQKQYRQLGVDLFEDCVSLNAINCRPTDKKGNNRPPTDHEASCCRQKVLAAIRQYKPQVIILQGGTAVSSLIGYRWKGEMGGITKWRGWTIPDREFGAWICPTFHPSFVERQEEESETGVIWKRDLKQAISRVGVPFPSLKPEEYCIIIKEDIGEVLDVFEAQEDGSLAFDIETTGLKPYDKEQHRIVSISLCNSVNEAYAIPFPTKRKHLQKLKRILENPNVGKIAANMKYEDNWLTVLHGIETSPWAFDTMQAAHILDNRPGITGLKFQTYVHFGMMGYDGNVTPYLKSGSSTGTNRIMELMEREELRRELLLYNGIDSLVTYRLSLIQRDQLRKGE